MRALAPEPMVANPSGTNESIVQKSTESASSDLEETHRGFSVRCSCGALAFDWITGESGGLTLKCSSCGERLLEAERVSISDRQLERLERLEDRRIRA